MIRRFSGQLKVILLIFDLFAFWFAFCAAYGLRHEIWFALPGEYAWVGFVSAGIMVFLFQRAGLYKLQHGFMEDVLTVAKWTAFTLLITLAILFFYRDFSYSRIFMSWLAPLLLISVILFRWLFQRVANSIQDVRQAIRNTLVVGCGVMGQNLISELSVSPRVNHMIGFLDDKSQISDYMGLKNLGGLNRLRTVISDYHVHEVFIAISAARENLIQIIIRICDEMNVSWRFVPYLHMLPFEDYHLDFVGKIPLVGMKSTNIVGINYLLKRAFDFLASSLIIVLTSPILLMAALAVKISSPGPVFFKQDRIGLHGERFDFFKFRTMFVNNDDRIHQAYVAQWIKNNESHQEKENGQKIYKIEKDPRITDIGLWLRKFSVDELPQLFNVWCGDMSLVGPRPALQYEVDIYKPWHKKRLQAPPGITGLWQISGRNALSFEEMLNLDLAYIHNWSFENDIKILLKTIPVVLFGKAY